MCRFRFRVSLRLFAEKRITFWSKSKAACRLKCLESRIWVRFISDSCPSYFWPKDCNSGTIRVVCLILDYGVISIELVVRNIYCCCWGTVWMETGCLCIESPSKSHFRWISDKSCSLTSMQNLPFPLSFTVRQGISHSWQNWSMSNRPVAIVPE